MRVGVVDIGTNSMRLLITDGVVESGRWVEVTGLGRGVDESGSLSGEAMRRTLAVLTGYGELMDGHDVDRRAAIATSATRDAANREEFLAGATSALGVRPEVITGEREGSLAFGGATRDLDRSDSPTVADIGGGSTEFVTDTGTLSIDVGSVRLTDRMLGNRPATPEDLKRAESHVLDLFVDVGTACGELVGVAGTWTSLAAIDLDLTGYDRARVHHHRLDRFSIDGLISDLAAKSIEETAAISSLDPARAPVILSGAVIARCVLEVTGVASALVSERDSLDGLADELLAVP
jgi:exopolyphosphatase/guanosine-5'-triphosphate,3'-diphosphate pyrophosphatase